MVESMTHMVTIGVGIGGRGVVQEQKTEEGREELVGMDLGGCCLKCDDLVIL